MVINYWQVMDMSRRCVRILQNQFPFVRTNASCRIRSICLKYSIGFRRGARTNGPNLHDGFDMSPNHHWLYGRTMPLQFLGLWQYIFCPNLNFSVILLWSWGSNKKVAVVLYDCMWVATPIFLSLFPFPLFSPLFSSPPPPTCSDEALYAPTRLSIWKSQFPW